MTVVFYLIQDMERHELGEVCNGEVVKETLEGFSDWVKLEKEIPSAPSFTDEEELIRRYEGPAFVATYKEDESGPADDRL